MRSRSGLIALTGLVGTLLLADPFIAPAAARQNRHPDLVKELQGLRERVKKLESLLQALSVRDGGKTLRLTGVDLQIVSGAGQTDGVVTGRGNLIVGYNANNSADCAENGDRCEADFRTGSHNLIVGDHHVYTSFGGIVGGKSNALFGPWSTVSGGVFNTASGIAASVSGGSANEARGDLSSVSGGFVNAASGVRAAVSGGQGNTASGDDSVVAGGIGNEASGEESAVSGGSQNLATTFSASVSGGFRNVASGAAASVSGGEGRSATGDTTWAAGALSEPN